MGFNSGFKGLKDISDSSANINVEIPPKCILQLIMPIEDKICKKIVLTCNTALRMSPEDEHHTQHTYLGNLNLLNPTGYVMHQQV